MNDIKIELAKGLENIPAAQAIRQKVFVEEQGFQLEFDGTDPIAWHAVLWLEQVRLAAHFPLKQRVSLPLAASPFFPPSGDGTADPKSSCAWSRLPKKTEHGPSSFARRSVRLDFMKNRVTGVWAALFMTNRFHMSIW